MIKKHWIACVVMITLATALFGASTFFPDFYRSFNPKKGEWASYRLTDAKGETATLTFAVVGEEAGAVWLEVRSEQEGVEGIAAYLLKGDPSKDENVLKLRVQSEPGKVLEFDQRTLFQLKEMDPAAFGGSAAVPIGPTVGKLQGLADETLQVGKRKLKCRHLKVVGPDREAEVWVSDKVTPFGIVRLVSGPEEVLLLDFGKGAEAKVQGVVTPFSLP
jgi:hypothetical protein